MRSKAHNQSRLMRIITIPLRALGKARDFYVRSLTDCAERVTYGAHTMGGIGGHASLPRSFSVNSSRSNDSEDFTNLIRAASARSLGDRIDMALIMQQQARARQSGGYGLPKSCSVGMGRIDEDMPCDFGDEDGGVVNLKGGLLYPRSRSYAVAKNSVVF